MKEVSEMQGFTRTQIKQELLDEVNHVIDNIDLIEMVAAQNGGTEISEEVAQLDTLLYQIFNKIANTPV